MRTRLEIVGDRYALLDVISSGTNFEVHLGKLLALGAFPRTVAIKRLRGGDAGRPERREMVLEEARVVARVQHSNVVRTLDVVKGADELFFVTEHVPGESLDRLVSAARERARRLPHGVAAGIVAGVLRGLHAAHVAVAENEKPLGIVHREVSPESVLVGADGIARITDFGLTRTRERFDPRREGRIQGRLPYMAPEQLFARRCLDARTDIYGAAVVFWEALTGARLVEDDVDAAISAALRRRALRRPREVDPKIPRALDAIVMKGLAQDPSARFATALEMALAIEAFGVAPAPEVGACVQALAGDELGARSSRIAQIERQFVADSMRPAFEAGEWHPDELETLVRSAPPPSVRRPASTPPPLAELSLWTHPPGAGQIGLWRTLQVLAAKLIAKGMVAVAGWRKGAMTTSRISLPTAARGATPPAGPESRS
jgi:serine/threonine protein kinase